jgi:type I restriction enzyme R subunit
MLKDPHLKESAKSNTESDFELAYFDQVNKSLIKGLSQNKDFFTYLLNTPEIRKEVMGIFAQEVYRSLKKDK